MPSLPESFVRLAPLSWGKRISASGPTSVRIDLQAVGVLAAGKRETPTRSIGIPLVPVLAQPSPLRPTSVRSPSGRKQTAPSRHLPPTTVSLELNLPWGSLAARE